MCVFGVLGEALPAVGLPATGNLLVDDREDLVFGEDQHLFAVDLNLGASVGREQDAVLLLDRQSLALTVITDLAEADGDDDAFLWLLLGSVWEDDAASGLRISGNALDEHAVA